MTARKAVYQMIADSQKGRLELVANPHVYYGSKKVAVTYMLKLHKFNIGEAFVWRVEFEGDTEKVVFEKAHKFIIGRKNVKNK